MKNIVHGRPAVALVAAALLFFAIHMTACGGAGNEAPPLGAKGGQPAEIKAVLSCVGISCPTLMLRSTDTSHGVGPKRIFEGVIDSTLAAGTVVRVTVYLTDSVNY